MVRLKLRVGEVLRERGITARQLAADAGIAVATMRALALGENGRIDFKVIEQVANALNVRPISLFEEIEIPGEQAGNNTPTRSSRLAAA